MYLKKLLLRNFKNYEAIDLEFPSKINFLVGRNGGGKTNLLDAVYYLSATKSFSNSIDSQNIRFSSDHFEIKGIMESGTKSPELFIRVQQGRKKIFRDITGLLKR